MVLDRNHQLQEPVPDPIHLRKRRILGVGYVESPTWYWTPTTCCKNWFLPLPSLPEKAAYPGRGELRVHHLVLDRNLL
jgi:hypothetical protein